MEPLNLFKCLADETRLITLLMIHDQGELCVCELTAALETSQPKMSRHLAQLRECGLLDTRRAGQWVYYRLGEGLPDWVARVLALTAAENPDLTLPCRKRLERMGDRPERSRTWCEASA